MKIKKNYNQKEFMEAAGINNRQRLNQLMNGYKSKGTEYPPLLIEGIDYKKQDIVFFESAVDKLKNKATHP